MSGSVGLLGEQDGYVARAEALIPLLTEAASRTEAARELADDVVAALHRAGLFRVLMPTWLHGGETKPSVFIELIETIARGDASTAWCLCQMNVCSLSSVYLGREAALEVFGATGAALAWGNTPYAKAVKVDGGYRVSGEWDFGSGCHHASWLGGHCPVIDEHGQPIADEDAQQAERTVLFPKSAAQISDVWHVIGLRGTGSDRYSLDGLFVPERHAITTLMRWPDAPRQEMAAPYCFGGGSLYASGFGAVALGNARGMFDLFVDLARSKTARGMPNPLAESALTQVAIAESDTILRSARTYLVQTLREFEDAATEAGGLTMDQRMRIRAAGTFAIRQATRVVDRLYEMAGTTAIFEGNPFGRRFRDAHTVSQHLQGRISHFETVGKHLLGVANEPRFV
ncbi:MAG TPA: acyl-CoA dehydrogenase family protein [Stellaceae bacterium]|nr:acyl-CoA dehydrogenase family protein [Stellaceae bacterium]